MLTRSVPLGDLPEGSRFRFREEPRSQGFPYTVLPIPTTYRGEQHFAQGETPVVIYRKDGRYPRYGTVAGYFPVQNEAGKIVRWVAHPRTEVLVPRPWALRLMSGALTALAILVALAGVYLLLARLGGA